MIKIEEVLKDIPEEKQNQFKTIFEEHRKEKEAFNNEKKAFDEQKAKELLEINKQREQVEQDKENVLFDREFGLFDESKKKFIKNAINGHKVANKDKTYAAIVKDVKDEVNAFFSTTKEEPVKAKPTVFPKDAQNIVPNVEDKQKLNDYSNDIIGMLNPDLLKTQKIKNK